MVKLLLKLWQWVGLGAGEANIKMACLSFRTCFFRKQPPSSYHQLGASKKNVLKEQQPHAIDVNKKTRITIRNPGLIFVERLLTDSCILN